MGSKQEISGLQFSREEENEDSNAAIVSNDPKRGVDNCCLRFQRLGWSAKKELKLSSTVLSVNSIFRTQDFI